MSHPPQCWLALQKKKNNKAWSKLYVIIYVILTSAALHGHDCIVCNHDNQAGPALRRRLFFLCMQGFRSDRGQKATDATQEVCSLTTKAPNQLMRFCFLCGLY